MDETAVSTINVVHVFSREEQESGTYLADREGNAGGESVREKDGVSREAVLYGCGRHGGR